MILLRLTDCKEYPVTAAMDTPFRPLPGMYFFDAWRITPCQAQRLVATEKRSEESPLEQVTNEEDTSAWVKPPMPKKAAEAAPDGNFPLCLVLSPVHMVCMQASALYLG